jgi:hypothetical protein
MHVVIGFLAVLLVFSLIRYGINCKPAERRRLVYIVAMMLASIVLLMLLLTGRIHYLAALGAAALPFIRKLPALLRYIPMLSGLFNKKSENSSTKQTNSDQTRSDKSSTDMPISMALQILELKEGASKDDILDAHRKLMQKLHPDRGGSNFLAAQVNMAKETLLANLSA